jgi:Holliday junction resolvasome RuvABC ATP-dependent DNA helicase subunit
MGLLANSFRQHLEAFLVAHQPARILVGGLPEFIIEAIAASWTSPFQLYLVSMNRGAALPANVTRCGADDLTAVRQGAWAALVSPQESSRIQESIRSSGAGTVRELWQAGFPWEACELPGARWADVRDDFVKKVGLGPVAQAASTCVEQFREELSGESGAAELFFQALDALPTGGVAYNDLCFYLGFPAHRPGSVLRKRADRNAVLVILDEFIGKFLEDVADDALDQLLDIARGRYAGDAAKLAAIEDALKYFTDEFRHLSAANADTCVLAWRTVFRGSRLHWETLSTDVLASLLGTDPKGLTFGQILQFSSGPGIGLTTIGENMLIFRDRNSRNHAVMAEFLFSDRAVREATNAAAAGSPWQLHARVNRVRSVLAPTMPATKGPHSYATAVPSEGKQAIRYALGPSAGAERATSNVFTLWECCQDYPLIIASIHAKVRARRRKRSRDEQSNTYFSIEQVLALPSQGRVVLHGFVYGAQGALNVRVGADESAITPALSAIPNSSCQQFSLTLDASEDLEVQFQWNGPSGSMHQGFISFEFKGEAGPRDDSVADVLVRAHGVAGGKQLKEQLAALKKGEQISPAEVPVRESTKPIAAWERHQQDTGKGWWPILASIEVELRQQRLREKDTGYLRISDGLKLDAQANAWRTLVESPSAFSQMPGEVKDYVESRATVIDALARQFKLVARESLDEVNIARTAVIGVIDSALLCRYVDAYSALLVAARQASFPGEWRCIAWCLDSAVLFEENSSAPTSQLLGPFHAVSLARLYFVQRCLVERLLDNERCPLARALVHTQPLALGHVVDAQLQPTAGIAFATGDPQWLWLYRQKGESSLPPEWLLAWLREAGLDPQIGPLGVDADALPDTMKQYLLAYPSRQTLRLAVDDCSQRTYEVLRDEMLLDEGGEVTSARLRARLPGGISVYDPVTKLKEIDGELLSYDPDLALRWHHATRPAGLTIDIATLPPSNRVDFQATTRGGATSSAVPTVRRGIVQFGPYGLEVASEISNGGTDSGLAKSSRGMIALYEPAGQQLSWGTSLSILDAPKANWTLCSAGQVDPRLFIDYVVAHPGTALWTYRLFGSGASRTPDFGRGHFLVARVTEALANGLDVLLSGIGIQIHPEELLKEIAEAGLTLGDEFLRTGRAAEGALGQYLVQRLLWRPSGATVVLPHWTTTQGGDVDGAGFLLQVDPIRSVLGTLLGEDPAESDQRSDLISVHLQLCGDELWIRPVVFESKLIRSGQADIDGALEQARATAKRVDHLLEYCLHDPAGARESWWSQPERLLLVDLIHLGLRITRGSFTGDVNRWHAFERRVLSKVLSGDYRRDDAAPMVVVHHKGNTVNGVDQNPPHVLMSFSDVNAARIGAASTKYQEIAKALRELVLHKCGAVPHVERRSGEPDAAELREGKQAPSAGEKVPPVGEEVPPPVGPFTAQPKETGGAQLDTTHDKELAEAHAAFDAAFRDFIGNRQAIEKLRDDLVDALIKQPPHLASAYLLTGNPSTGKTTLANKIADLLDVTFIKLVGTNIRSEADLIEQVDNAFRAGGKQPRVTPRGSQGVPEHEYAECLIFIDEIHLVKGRAQEGLLTLTEPNDRYVRLRDRICRFPRATYVAATTRDSEIDRALRTRFGNPIHLNDYKVEEVATMLRVKRDIWAAWPEEIRMGLAKLSRCIPREAERMAQKLGRKLSVSRERVSLEVALERLRVEEGLDRNGLDQVCWAALRLLAKQARPLGRETLAQQMGVVDEDKLVSEIIPSLRYLGLVEQVAGGQVITDRGRNYLRNEAPPTSS